MKRGRSEDSVDMQDSHRLLKPGSQVSGSSKRLRWMVTWKITCAQAQGSVWPCSPHCLVKLAGGFACQSIAVRDVLVLHACS